QTFEDPQSSLRWRDFEYSYALPQIASHPLTGLGLGSSYRPFVPGKDWAGHDRTRFIHNGYLHIMVKSGLLAFLCFFSFSLVSLWRGFKFWRQVYDRQFQAIVLGFTLAFLGILIGSFVSAMIVKSYWTPVIGIMLGINEVILKFWREKSGIDQAIMIRDSTTVGSS
ncbi:MAG TPA: O-antigen ligase family protein, partial [Patescibacteria group bacterium]|nr:O-antigen ligase family protein [Patescibacteria group bacterium]